MSHNNVPFVVCGWPSEININCYFIMTLVSRASTYKTFYMGSSTMFRPMSKIVDILKMVSSINVLRSLAYLSVRRRVFRYQFCIRFFIWFLDGHYRIETVLNVQDELIKIPGRKWQVFVQVIFFTSTTYNATNQLK